MITAQLSHYGNHWFLTSPVELSGRGVTFQKTLTAEELAPVPAAQDKVGHHRYKVTDRAFDKIRDEHQVTIL